MSALDSHAQDKRWVAWRGELRSGKTTKIPYGAGGRKAKADDPATWICRDEAQEHAKRIANGLGGGIGYQLVISATLCTWAASTSIAA